MQGITKHFYDVRFWVYVFLYLLFSISIPHQVKAAFPNRKEEDKIVFGETYYLHGGEVITGDLIVFGGEVFLYPNSKVTQNVIIFGGNLNNEGIIE